MKYRIIILVCIFTAVSVAVGYKKFIEKPEVKKSRFIIQKTKEKVENNYTPKTRVRMVELPDIDRSQSQNSLPASPNPDYLKSLSFIQEFDTKDIWYKRSVVKSQKSTDTYNVKIYGAPIYTIEELLFWGDYQAVEERVKNNVQKYGETHSDEYGDNKERILLANYFATHGACDKALPHYEPYLEKHPVVVASLSGKQNREYLGKSQAYRVRSGTQYMFGASSIPVDPKYTKNVHRSHEYLIKNLASILMLCESQKAAINFVENYISGLSIGEYTSNKLLKKWQAALLMSIYSKMGADLLTAGYSAEGDIYLELATSFYDGETYLYPQSIVFHVLHSNYRKYETGNFSKRKFPRVSVAKVLSIYQARNGDLQKVLGYKHEDDFSNVVALEVYLRKVKREKGTAELLKEVEKIRQDLSTRNARGQSRRMLLLVRAYAWAGEFKKAKELLGDPLTTRIHNNYPSFEREQTLNDLIFTYVVIDRAPYRAFEAYKKHIKQQDRSHHPLDRSYRQWAYLVAAGKYVGDKSFLKLLQKEGREYNKTQRSSLDILYYLELGELETAKNFARNSKMALDIQRVASYLRGDFYYLSPEYDQANVRKSPYNL